MISVIVPVYGVEKYLPKCIESLVKQTFKDIEIILVDDGSPDSCGKICDEYAENYEQLVVIHQVNQGVSVARNAGLKIAKGEYIGFVDPDDYVDCQMYEVMVNKLQASLADLVVCGYSKIWESSKKTEKFCLTDKIVSAKNCLNDLFDFRGGGIKQNLVSGINYLSEKK